MIKMCDMNNNCDYEGVMNIATGPKDVCLYHETTDREIRIPSRLSVDICPECGEADWRTLGLT